MGIIFNTGLFWYGDSKGINRIESLERETRGIWGTLNYLDCSMLPPAEGYISIVGNALTIHSSQYPFLLPPCYLGWVCWPLCLIGAQWWRNSGSSVGKKLLEELLARRAVLLHAQSSRVAAPEYRCINDLLLQGIAAWLSLQRFCLSENRVSAEFGTKRSAFDRVKCVWTGELVSAQPLWSEGGKEMQKFLEFGTGFILLRTQ